DEFGVTPELMRDSQTGEPKRIIVPSGVYLATPYPIEPDASNATYFLAAAAIHPGAKVVVNALGKRSPQGDVGFGDVLRKMGTSVVYTNDSIAVEGPDRLEGIDVNLAD